MLTYEFRIRYAAIATDGQLKPYDEGVCWAIRTPKANLDAMDEWCTRQHGEVRMVDSLLHGPSTID